MKGKPLFFVLLVASLCVALMVTAVGPDGAAAADSSVSDPQGDVLRLRFLYPAPNPARDLTIQDNTVKVLVPRSVLGYPQSFQWVGGTIRLSEQDYLDVAPDMKVLDWTRGGATSEAPDAQNPELLPHEDLISVRLRELADTRLEFFWRCRGDIPTEPADLAYGAFMAEQLVGNPDFAVVITQDDAAWVWSVSVLGETSFPWATTDYEDILSAAVSQSGDGQLTFEMTMAQDIPDVPAQEDASPVFSWILDQEGEGTLGAQFDMGVVVRWNADETLWEGLVMSWDGQEYVELDVPVTMTRSGATVSATVAVADLGLQGTFYWGATTAIQIGPDEELFAGLADHAPDEGWVEETLPAPPTPTPPSTPQRIYLPLICRSATI